ncbi:uncharacterized protein LOC114953371 [Acropora millepora]|uniref:uncharacterized protein LOC114953371 n=1 Tax=Acropora millepora TaxID=45264 RepID=UPI001CF56FC1|nr:uncharacterized protein LOC114953371 [Acropora millepora]
MLAFGKRNPVLKFFLILQGPIQRKRLNSRSFGWLSVFCILSMCASCDFQGCKTAASVGGFRFPGHTISTHSEPSIWSCFRSCKLKMPLKCHSINYNLETFQCEINNRTKNGKPHDFVYRSEYVYLENPFRARLGAVQSLPGLSCKDIKDSNEDSATGEYWIDPTISNDAFTVFCDMQTDGGGWTLVAQTLMRSSIRPKKMIQSRDLKSISSYASGKVRVHVNALLELQRLIKFTQLRFFCHQNSTGRIFHIMTKRNPAGKAAVHYLIESSKTRPPACGSFEALPDDNSILAANCDKWGNNGRCSECNKWGNADNPNGYRLYNNPVSWKGKSYVNFHPKDLACDGFSNASLSKGDIWQLFVR